MDRSSKPAPTSMTLSARRKASLENLPRTTHPSPLAREINLDSLRLTPLDSPNDDNPVSGPSSGASTPSLSRSSSRRRRFSHRSDDGAANSSTFSTPMFGSYKHSLLSGRFSGAASSPTPFTLTLSINSLPPFRNFFVPPKLHLPFEASFYEIHGPWVGAIDLDEAPQLKTKTIISEGGYRVPPKGQVQLVIKNQLGTIMKVLVVPYDLKDMPPGTQAPIRRIWYGEAPLEPADLAAAQEHPEKEFQGKEVIRYAVHMKFVCPETVPGQRPRARSDGHATAARSPFSKMSMTSMSSANVERDAVDIDDGELSSHSAGESAVRRKKYVRSASSIDPRKIYLAGEIRLVFSSRIPDEEEAVRAETEEGRANEKYYNWDPQAHSPTSPRSPSRN
ncbi:hypothetical protein M422DRAFT_33239 [Sphaerobolus stellatus SS14]|uniref:Atos-like conserved domain-containing protein n=1 Tax=Sphaerobolus stellatus (strain SS14) TaxID=990650 RepID=A0A0C9VL00_SPHS4|nr:hypothetical protein M422DRAFT_33239 [Sphaerobolus stellatus SS14]